MKQLFLLSSGFVLLVVFFVGQAQSWDVPLDIDVIRIDFLQGYANGALNIQKRRNVEVKSPEWDSTIDRNEPCAYIKSQTSRQVEVKFHNLEGEDVNSILAYANVISGTGIGDLGGQTVYFNGGKYSSYTTFTVNVGSVPSTVGKRNFIWKWCVIKVNDTILGCEDEIGNTGSHVHYTVLADPQSPMEEPWTDVLDDACVWATGKTTESAALDSITSRAWHKDMTWYGGWTHALCPNFDLTDMVSDEWMDCRDMAAYVHVCTRAIGGTQTKVKSIIGRFGTKGIMYFNTSEWATATWDFHQINWYNSSVYDAYIMIRSGLGENERIPIGEDIDDDYYPDLVEWQEGWTVNNDSSFTNVY